MFNKKNIMQFIEKQMLLCKFFDLFAIHLYIAIVVTPEAISLLFGETWAAGNGLCINFCMPTV